LSPWITVEESASRLVADSPLSWAAEKALTWVEEKSPKSVVESPFSWLAVRPAVWVVLSDCTWPEVRAERLAAECWPTWVEDRPESGRALCRERLVILVVCV